MYLEGNKHSLGSSNLLAIKGHRRFQEVTFISQLLSNYHTVPEAC